MVKQLTILTFGLALVAACGETPADPLNQRDGLMAARQARVTICHVKENGEVDPITVAAAAVPAHEAHGDGEYEIEPVHGGGEKCVKKKKSELPKKEEMAP